MLSVTSLLVLACACAITVNAQDDKYCVPVPLKGNLSPYPVQLEAVAFSEKITDVQIPNVCAKGKSGVSAYVCDNDSYPNASFLDMDNLLVERTGSLDGYATASVTVYCN